MPRQAPISPKALMQQSKLLGGMQIFTFYRNLFYPKHSPYCVLTIFEANEYEKKRELWARSIQEPEKPNVLSSSYFSYLVLTPRVLSCRTIFCLSKPVVA